jgi:multiple sugar transport system permease protein
MSNTLPAITGDSLSRWDRWSKTLRRTWTWYLFILPNLVLFVGFFVVSWIQLVSFSFSEWDFVSPRTYVGLDNYIRLMSDPKLLKAALNTVEYAVLVVIPKALIALALAVLVNSVPRARALFRGMYFLPVVTSVSVIAIIWWRLFAPRPEGPVNYAIGLLGIPPQDWLLDVKQALPTVAGMSVWAGLGYNMVIWMAGLQAIPEELYEAARVDGAEGWTLFRHITVPMLRGTALFVFVVSTIAALQVYGEVYILTGGGPVNATLTVVYYLWSQAFQFFKMGYGAAIGVALFVVIFVISIVQRLVLGTSSDTQ